MNINIKTEKSTPYDLLRESKDVVQAYAIAVDAHGNQVDKGGNLYIWHPVSVAKMFNSETEQIVALLHDVVEDTNITLQDLKRFGISEENLAAIDAISRRKGESIKNYLRRVKANSLAKIVKLADLQHNCDISRIPNPTVKDFARIMRYKKEIDFLSKEE